MVEVDCSHCGATLDVYPSRVERKDNHFCDSDCYGSWRSENVHGENHPQANRVEVECANCGDTKRVPRSRSERHDRHFCSDECESEWKSLNLTGVANPNAETVYVECAACGDEFHISRCRTEYADNVFCDRDCYADWQASHQTGENHPNFSGGYRRYYGDEWYERRDKVRDRDGGVCRVCETPTDENGRELPVHHIIPVRTFDDPNEAHTMANMVQVCDECHPMMEQLPPMEQVEMIT